MNRACKLCRDDRTRDYKRPKRPSPPPIRTIEDDFERYLEQVIRRVTRVTVTRRLYEIRRGVEAYFEWPVEILYPSLTFGEDYQAYRERTKGRGAFKEWFVSRIFSDPRLQRELTRPDSIILDPLLRGETERARRRRALEERGSSSGATTRVIPISPRANAIGGRPS